MSELTEKEKAAAEAEAFFNEMEAMFDAMPADMWDETAIRRRTAQIERWSDPAERAKISEANRRNADNPDYREQRSKAVKTRFSDPAQRAKQSLARMKPIQTPDGVFPSCNAAAEHYGVGSSAVRNWTTRHPDQYFYIDKQ